MCNSVRSLSCIIEVWRQINRCLSNHNPIAIWVYPFFVFIASCYRSKWSKKIYYICFNMCSVSNVLSTIIAWVLSVVFAFFTNKMWVFGSKSYRAKTMISESVSFLASRAFTGVLDVIIMWITVDLCRFNASLWKLLSNIIVVILNYVLSKLFVFKKK